MANEDILKRIEADRKASAFRNKAQVSDQRLGEFSDVNYSKGFGQLYDKTSSGNYEMKFQNYLGLEGNEDRLAKQQSAWEQVGNGLWKNLNKVGLYVADNVNTVTYGLYSAIKDQSLKSLWDNDVSNYLDEASKKLDRDFANYYTDEEKSKGFFGRIFTNPANFLANDVAGGLAFIGGAVLPELAIGVLSGGASLPVSLAKFTAKTAFKSADNIASALTREGMEASAKAATVGARMTRQQAKSGYKALLRGNVGAKAGEVLNTARFIGQTTFFEAGMEARHNFHDSVDGYMNSFQQREGRLPDSAELTEYMKDAGKAADYVFGANVALLSVTNAAMFGKLFNLPSLGLDTKIGKAFGLDVTKLSTGKMAINEATKAQKVLGNTYFLTKKPFSEGVVEEGLQGVFGHTMNNYLDSKYNPNQPDMSLMSSFSEALVEQYTTKEGWFEIGIGAIIGMVGGNVSGDFGVEGIGKKGYGGASRVLSSKVDAYNEGTQKALEGLIRSNSVAAYNTGEEAGIDGSPSFQDTLVSYNYIKANDNLKGYTDTVLDFNAAVDSTQFTEEQKKQFGFKDDAQVEAYKESLKDNFKNDYDTYQEVESIVNNLQIPDMKEGDMKEFKDAVSFSLMAGKKAGVESAKIAENLSQITGIDGIYDTLKFAQEMDEQYNGNIEQLKEKQARLETLKNEILDVGQRLEESKGNEQLYKENSKKHTILTREIRNLTNETLELENAMEKDFQAMQANITFTPSEFVGRSIKDIVGRMDTLDEYISALKNTGRTKEAQNIEGLVKQFAEYSSAEINSINTMRRMSETNFYSTKEGKAAVKKVRGEDYSMTDQARKEIEENEESVRDILIKNGFEYSNVGEVIEGALKANDKLSEREKFKLESMLRTTLAYQRIQAKLEEASTTQDAATEDEAAEDFSVEGDTISMRKKLQGKDLTNPETINQLIKDITNEIDVIVNQPTKENLDLIKEKEAQIEALKKQLLEESSTHQVGKESTLDTPSPTSKALSKLLKIKDGVTTPIMVEGEQVGEITTETIGDKVHVRRVDITPQNQNLGYAKQAYRQAHEVALKDGKVLASDTLQTNPEATRIWDSLVNEGVAIKNEDGTYEMKVSKVDNIEPQKADIERRRQEELDKEENLPFDFYPRIDIQDSDTETKNTFYENERKNKEQSDKRDKINAKYDAELKALEKESVDQTFEELLLEGLRKYLESALNSEFVSPERAAILQEQIDALTEQEIDEVITEIEQDDNTGENGTNTGAENVSNTDGEGQQDDGGTTDEAAETIDTEILDREEQTQQITESIQRLEDEIAELKVPFKFMDSEGYKRYNELLKKKINEGVLSPEEETELGNLGTSINQWIAITGARVQGIELSDLIKQLQALEATTPAKTSTTQEISDEEVVQDAMESEDSIRNNYDFGLSFNAVVARRTKSHTVSSNISIEDLEKASGVTLQGVPGVEITETKSIKIPHELVDEINSAGKIMIINPATDETSTYYSLVLEQRPNKVTGEMELYPMDSTFDTEYPDAIIDPEVIFGVKAGEGVAFQIDPNHPYNVDLFNELRKETGINKPLTEEEFQEEVEKVAQQKALKSKTVIKTQAEIAQFQAKEKTTTITANLNKLNKRLKEQLAEIRTASEDEVLNRKEKKPKKPSAELIDKLIKKLRISVVTGDTGFNLQVLKGLRESEGYEGTNPHFEALRIKLASDPQALMDLLEVDQADTYNEPVTISKVFMGHPNFIYSKNEDGALVKKSAPIVEEDLDKISDIGYIQNGKLKLRSGKTEDVNTDFVKSALSRKSDTKAPVIVIKKGKHLIAFPAKVAREDSPIDLNRFRSIYESETLSGVDKAIRLNTMLAEAGIDVKQPGNAFIVIGENSLNEDFFNNIFAQLNNKEYLRSVDSWVDAKQSISETLLDNASVNIRLSQPFISPKVKFDFSKIEVQEMPEAKKKSTKKAVVSNKKSALKNFRCK